MSQFILPSQFANDKKGRTLPGSELWFYESGTFNYLPVYIDSDLTTPHTQPVVADGSGRFPLIYMTAAVSYRVQLRDNPEDSYSSEGIIQWQIDDVVPDITLADARLGLVSQEDTEATMIANEDLAVGNTVLTSGKDNANDGAGQYYTIDTTGDIELNNGLFATVAIAAATIQLDSIQDISSTAFTIDKQQATMIGWHPSSNVGGGSFYYDASIPKSSHNGGTIFSPTVPYTAATADYLNGVGETDPAGSGCLVRVRDEKLLDLYDFGADTAAADNKPSIDAIIATLESFTISEGTFLTSGEHNVQAKQSIYGAGLGKSILQHTAITGDCVRLPLYGANEAVLEFGGNYFGNFSIIGAGRANLGTSGLYIKNKGDVLIEHVQIEEFGYGVLGARDDPLNTCNQITFLNCRIRANNIGGYCPIAWNGCRIIGGTMSGEEWSLIVYDTIDFTADTVFQGPTTQTGSVFLGGCSAFKMSGYYEGDTTTDAFLHIASNKDVTGSPTNNGIAILSSDGGIVHGNTFTSGPGILYCVFVDGAEKVMFTGNSAGSGIGSALVRLATGATKCVAMGNHANPGTIFSYQTPADADNNIEYTDSGYIDVASTRKLDVSGGTPASGTSGGLVAFAGGDTANIFYDGNRNNDVSGIFFNSQGYQGGTTRFRRFYVQDGKGATALGLFPDVPRADITLPLRLTNLPTSSAGLSPGDLWNNAGVVNIV